MTKFGLSRKNEISTSVSKSGIFQIINRMYLGYFLSTQSICLVHFRKDHHVIFEKKVDVTFIYKQHLNSYVSPCL